MLIFLIFLLFYYYEDLILIILIVNLYHGFYLFGFLVVIILLKLTLKGFTSLLFDYRTNLYTINLAVILGFRFCTLYCVGMLTFLVFIIPLIMGCDSVIMNLNLTFRYLYHVH